MRDAVIVEAVRPPVTADEGVRRGGTLEKLSKLEPMVAELL